MTSGSSLFHGLDVKELEGRAVDEMLLSVLDARGNLVKIPALDKSWPLLSLKSQYVKFPGWNLLQEFSSGSRTTSKEQMALWRSAAQVYCDELRVLTLETSYDRFWCHVLYQPTKLLHFLRSFTTKACRSYDLQEMTKEDHALHSRIAGLVFLAFLTVSCSRRSPTEHMSEKKHGEILQKFIKLPLLMDMCALYGEQEATKKMLAMALSSCFQKHRRLYTELRIAIRDISDSLFQPLEDRLSESDPDMTGKPVSQLANRDIIDVVGYICDILSTLQRITAVASGDIRAILLEAKLSSRLAQFAEKVVWIVNREVTERLDDVEGLNGPEDRSQLQHAARQCSLGEAALIDTFRRLTCPAFFVDEPSGQAVATALSGLLETLPHHQFFTVMYEKWAPIKRDVEMARRLQANLEESIVDFLAHAVKEAFQSQKLNWDYSTSCSEKEKHVKQDQQTSGTASQKPLSNPLPSTGPVNESGIEEVTVQILDMLGGMGLDKAYVKACVAHYKCDLNATVDAILSGSVPIEITNSVTAQTNEPPAKASPAVSTVRATPVSATSSAGPAAYGADYPKLVAHTAPGTIIEKVYYGKRDLYEETEEEVISDATRLVTIARVQQMYDDEYDDTYDEFGADGGNVHLNDKEDDVALELRAMAAEDKGRKPVEQTQKPQEKPFLPPPAHSTGNQRFPSRGPQRGRPAGPSVSEQQRGPRGPPPPTGPGAPGPDSHRDMGQRPPGNASHVQQEVRRHEETLDQEPPARSNDPWTRQMEDNYAANVARRPPGTAPAASGDARTRANKEKNKAHAANHNRKDRGQWKRNQGMF